MLALTPLISLAIYSFSLVVDSVSAKYLFNNENSIQQASSDDGNNFQGISTIHILTQYY